VTDFARSATILITAGTGSNTVTETVSLMQKGYLFGGGADFLYFAGTGVNRTLEIGKWGSGAEIRPSNYQTVAAYFRFGSVIGLDINGPYTSSSIQYNPTYASTYAYTAIPNYTTSPSAWTGNITTSPKVYDNTYHTLANVKAGKGDPCRLVGITAAQIQSFTTNAELYAAERGWRMFSAQENFRFVKGPNPFWPTWQEGDISYSYSQGTGTGTDPGSPYPGYYYANYYVLNGGNAANPAVAWFPVVTGNDPNTSGEALPALGRRISNGDPTTQLGYVGSYWSAAIMSSIAAYNFTFGGTPNYLYITSGTMVEFSLLVRCTRK
jgi:hypothetical protein